MCTHICVCMCMYICVCVYISVHVYKGQGDCVRVCVCSYSVYTYSAIDRFSILYNYCNCPTKISKVIFIFNNGMNNATAWFIQHLNVTLNLILLLLKYL